MVFTTKKCSCEVKQTQIYAYTLPSINADEYKVEIHSTTLIKPTLIKRHA